MPDEEEQVPECVLLAEKLGAALAQGQIPGFGYWPEELTVPQSEDDIHDAATWAAYIRAEISNLRMQPDRSVQPVMEASIAGGFRLHRETSDADDSWQSYLVLVIPEGDPSFTAAARRLRVEHMVCAQAGCQAYYDEELARQQNHTGWRWINGFTDEPWTNVHEHRLP